MAAFAHFYGTTYEEMLRLPLDVYAVWEEYRREAIRRGAV